jgi:hypothetical protein
MMTVKKTAEPSRVINPDGSLAPRPGAGIDPLAPSGLPPQGGVDLNGIPVKARQDYRTVPVGDVLPSVHVSRQRVGRRITELRETLTHIDRELAVSSPIGVTGQWNQYQADRINGLREHAATMRAEIDHLNSLSDQDAQLWARGHGAR